MGVSTLVFKTTLILGMQLVILLGCTFWWIACARRRTLDGEVAHIEASKIASDCCRASSSMVMRCIQGEGERWCATLLFLSCGVIAWMHFRLDLMLSVLGMTLVSILTAPLLALMMIDADQGDGTIALKIVILLIGCLGLLGLQQPSAFSAQGMIIVSGSSLLVLGRGVISLVQLRVGACLSARLGLFMFLLLVLDHFQGLAGLDDCEGNDWRDAIGMAVMIFFEF